MKGWTGKYASETAKKVKEEVLSVRLDRLLQAIPEIDALVIGQE